MNLFVVARHLNAPSLNRAVSALRAMQLVYPLLDPGTLQHFGSERLCAAFMHTGERAAAPRRYSFEDKGSLTLYDGCPVASGSHLAAHDAASLAQHWDELHERLEGAFFAVRLDAEGTLELLSDPLGKHQTFYWRDGEQLLVSNSVQLISRLRGSDELDPLGASMFVGMGYAGGDHTLTQGVKMFPDAERWTWRPGASAPKRICYFPVADLARQGQRPLTPETTARLALELGQPLAVLTEIFGPLECPITAGRDSRILVGLMMQRGLEADYFSMGEDDHPDVRIGRGVARTFGLPHRIWGQGNDVTGTWFEASRRVILQNDGLVTLMHIQNTVNEPETLEQLRVHLYGGGGEYGRGKWLSEAFLLAPQTRSSVEAYLYRKLNRNRALVTPVVKEVIRAHVTAQVGRLLDAGFALKDVPCAYFYHDYGRRWGGANSQQIILHRDVFGPYYTRAYIRAAFALPAAERLGERLTFELTRHLSPELHALPYESLWKPQGTPQMYGTFLLELPKTVFFKVQRRTRRILLKNAAAPKSGRAQQRQSWLEEKLPEMRSMALDDEGSPVWDFVRRDAFEHLSAPETPAAVRGASASGLFLALTLLQYGALHRAEAAAAAPVDASTP